MINSSLQKTVDVDERVLSFAVLKIRLCEVLTPVRLESVERRYVLRLAQHERFRLKKAESIARPLHAYQAILLPGKSDRRLAFIYRNIDLNQLTEQLALPVQLNWHKIHSHCHFTPNNQSRGQQHVR